MSEIVMYENLAEVESKEQRAKRLRFASANARRGNANGGGRRTPKPVDDGWYARKVKDL